MGINFYLSINMTTIQDEIRSNFPQNYLFACWVIFHAFFLSSADFFKIKIFKKILQEYHQSVKTADCHPEMTLFTLTQD